MFEKRKRRKNRTEDKKVFDQQLEDVSGGTREQTKELKDFIKKHDPDFTILNDLDVMRWLQRNSGIKFQSISVDNEKRNLYRLRDNCMISHSEVMSMLRDLWPEE